LFVEKYGRIYKNEIVGGGKLTKGIANCFCGVLDLLESGSGFDSHFTVDGNVVTIMPLTKEAYHKVYELSYNDGSNEKDHWIYGYAEDNSAIALLQKTYLRLRLSTGINLSTAKFFSPLVIKGSKPYITSVKTFDVIEFYGGVMDKLHTPGSAIESDCDSGLIKYKDSTKYTSEHEITLDDVHIRVVNTIKTHICIETGEVPDLKNSIHSALRFEFDSPQSLDTIQKYYSYAMNLFQFCTGRLNVHTEIRLFKREFDDPIFVNLIDGFPDYADDVINFTQVIRLDFLGEKLPNLLRLLNNKDEMPYLLFLPSRNENANKVLYTNVNDLCVAFEMEYAKLKNEASEDKKKAARELAEKLTKEVDSVENCPDDVKEKAKNILNAQLKAFSPSLKEKIIYFYEKYAAELRTIVEIKDHDKLGISEFYTDSDFKKMIGKFIEIRNRASHAGVQWNGGEKIFTHLKMLVYYSVLERAGFSVKDISMMLSWLFGWQF
jgi:hypothetical protein